MGPPPHRRTLPLRTLRRLALLALVGVPLVASCMTADDGLAAQARPVALAVERPDLDRAGMLEFRGAVELSGSGLGGLSGLSVGEDGRRFVAVSDVGRLVTGRFAYDGRGRLSGVSGVTLAPLSSAVRDGRELSRPRDSEELARLRDGGWLVSFEGTPRILRYPPAEGGPRGTPAPLRLPPELEDSEPSNGGIEAMAALPDGRLLILEEGESDGRAERRGWIAARDGGGWGALTYRAEPGFRPTGAAALPGGDLLVLERRVSLMRGWAARLVRVPAAEVRPGAVLEGRELARLEPPLLSDNFEAVAVRPGAAGETMIYIASDDNFTPLQRTLILMFALAD